MKRLVVIISMMALMFPARVGASNDDAMAIIARAWDHMRGSTSVSQLTMTVHRPSWKRTSTIRAWTMGLDNSIFQIIAPKKDKGNGTLKLGKEMWTYNPKINRVIKLPPSMMSQSWMGSDFSNNDLSKADSIIVDYTHEIIAMEESQGLKVYVIKALPKPEAPVIWGMQTIKIRQDGVLIEQSFHDEDLEPVKIMTTGEIADIGGRPFPKKWTMRSMDAQSQEEYTELQYDSLQFDVTLKKSRFKINALKKPMR